VAGLADGPKSKLKANGSAAAAGAGSPPGIRTGDDGALPEVRPADAEKSNRGAGAAGLSPGILTAADGSLAAGWLSRASSAIRRASSAMRSSGASVCAAIDCGFADVISQRP
jgi:hypothetical protein